MTPAQARLAAARRMSALPALVRTVLDDYAALAAQTGQLTEIPGMQARIAQQDAAIAKHAAEVAALQAEAAERTASRVADATRWRSERTKMQNEIATLRAELSKAKFAGAIQCKAEGCDHAAFTRGWCRYHYDQQRQAGRTLLCTVCGQPRSGARPGMCRACYLRTVRDAAKEEPCSRN